MFVISHNTFFKRSKLVFFYIFTIISYTQLYCNIAFGFVPSEK